MGVRSTAVVGLAILMVGPTVMLAQATAGEGRTLERHGRYQDAATTYRAVLENDPVSVAAWLGLERVLFELDQLKFLVPVLDSTLVSFPGDGFLRELQLRVWSSLHLSDSVTVAARRWIELVPDSPNPYRQWAYVLASVGNTDEALAVLEEVRARFGAAEAAIELRLFADRVQRIQTREAARARAYALERLIELADGVDAERARLDAAQAFADAGDFVGARRMLEGLSAVNEGAPADAGAAVATLIRVTAESGRIDEAEERLRSWQTRLRPSDAQRLRERIGWAWVVQGELDRALAILQGDSSVGAFAIRGWAALFGGDLRLAKERFLAAGPFALSRDQATRRTSMLALLQGVVPDTVPALGEALLWLERADTSRALDELEQVARDLPADGGRSPVLAFAGDLAKESGDFDRAESLLVEALDADSLGPSAPAAEYALGVVLAGSGRGEAAAARLEHMILNHPGSALVPEARRLLDQVRGAIPRS